MFRTPVVPAVAWAAFILVLTLAPGSDVPSWPWAEKVQLDKWVHAFLFCVQSVLLGRAFLHVRPLGHKASLLGVATGVAIAFGGAIEVMQEVMGAGRHGDWHDLMADAAGALVGLAVLRLLP